MRAISVCAVATLAALAATLASAAAPPSCTNGVHQLIVDAAGASRYYECAAPNFVGYRDCPAGTVTGTTLGPVAPGATPCSAFAGTTPGAQPGPCNGQTGFVCKHDTVAHTAQFYWCAPPFFEGWQACPPGLYCETEGMHALPPCTATVQPAVVSGGTTTTTITLDSSDAVFQRAECDDGDVVLSTPGVYYETRTVQVSAAGSLTVTSTHSREALMVLYSTFNPADAVSGALACSRDIRSALVLELASVTPGTYTLVLSANRSGSTASVVATLSGSAAALFV